ncbi:MAG: A24 family peptidase [Sandaracinobacteroides sp.]
METLFAMALAAPLLAAAVVDVRRRMIPDWTVAMIAAAGLLEAFASGSLTTAVAAGLLCLLLGALAGYLGVWGWGDAKLIGAAGLAAGWSGLLPLFAGTAIVGGIIAGLLLLLRQPVRAGWLALPEGAPRWLRVEQTRLRRAPTIPYAIAIAAGLALALSQGA